MRVLPALKKKKKAIVLHRIPNQLRRSEMRGEILLWAPPAVSAAALTSKGRAGGEDGEGDVDGAMMVAVVAAEVGAGDRMLWGEAVVDNKAEGEVGAEAPPWPPAALTAAANSSLHSFLLFPRLTWAEDEGITPFLPTSRSS